MLPIIIDPDTRHLCPADNLPPHWHALARGSIYFHIAEKGME
jgi:hypothetical protein